MFYLGLGVGASIMTILSIIAYEWHVRTIKAEAKWWEDRAAEYGKRTRELEDRVGEAVHRAFARGQEQERHITAIVAEEKRYQDMRDAGL